MPPSYWVSLPAQHHTGASDHAAASTLDARTVSSDTLPSDALRRQTETISPDNRGLAYADGFFTTMGVMDGQILWSAQHEQRLLSHAQALQLAIDSQTLLATLQAYAKQLQEGMLKLIVTRAPQAQRGYGYTPSASGSACEMWLKVASMTVATAAKLPLPDGRVLSDGRVLPIQPVGAAVCLTSKIACLPPPLAGLKSLSRLDTVMASAELERLKTPSQHPHSLDPSRQESHSHLSDAKLGPTEGLLRDMSGCWVEGTMSNVFYQLADTASLASKSLFGSDAEGSDAEGRDYLTTGQWYTPSMAQSGVAGVMRRVIIEALARTDQPVIIRSLQDEDLPRLSQLFFCNALRGIMPMTSLTLLSGGIVEFTSV